MPYENGIKVPYNHGKNERGIFAVNTFSGKKIHFDHNFDVLRVMNISAKVVSDIIDTDGEYFGYKYISA